MGPFSTPYPLRSLWTVMGGTLAMAMGQLGLMRKSDEEAFIDSFRSTDSPKSRFHEPVVSARRRRSLQRKRKAPAKWPWIVFLIVVVCAAVMLWIR